MSASLRHSRSPPWPTTWVGLERPGSSWPLPDELDDARARGAAVPADRRRPTVAARCRTGSDVHPELRRPGVTLQLLWLEYREDHPDGYGYSQFCQHYRPGAHLDVVMRQDHRAGEKLFVDFAGLTIPIYDRRPAGSSTAELFVAVLGASTTSTPRRCRPRSCSTGWPPTCTPSSSSAACPEIVVCDNLRSGVTKAAPLRARRQRHLPGDGRPLRHGDHAGPAPTSPATRPRSKRGCCLAERWIIARLRHQRFSSPGRGERAIAELREEINARPFKKMDGSRRSLFEELDRPALRPLPAERYEFAIWKQAKVNIDYHVEVDRHYYSVPYQLVGEVLDVR